MNDTHNMHPEWVFTKDITGATYVRISDKPVVTTKVLTDGLNLDLDENGKVAGIEVMLTKQELDDFLAEESRKLKYADYLWKKMWSYWFGPFDPRWWKAKREYHDVVMSFRIG